jgi:hypothetical protein
MQTKPARGFAITAGLITALMLSTLSHRNDAFEFCTTRAFGFPFRGANLLLASGAAAALTWATRGTARRSRARAEVRAEQGGELPLRERRR